VGHGVRASGEVSGEGESTGSVLTRPEMAVTPTFSDIRQSGTISAGETLRRSNAGVPSPSHPLQRDDSLIGMLQLLVKTGDQKIDGGSIEHVYSSWKVRWRLAPTHLAGSAPALAIVTIALRILILTASS